MFVEQLQRAVEASPRVELAKVASLLWRAYAAGQVSEDQASELSDLIESRRALPAPQRPIQRRLGSRPRSLTCLDGAARALGRLRSLAAGPGDALHPGRDSCPGRDRGRGSAAWALRAGDRAHRGPGRGWPLHRQARLAGGSGVWAGVD